MSPSCFRRSRQVGEFEHLRDPQTGVAQHFESCPGPVRLVLQVSEGEIVAAPHELDHRLTVYTVEPGVMHRPDAATARQLGPYPRSRPARIAAPRPARGRAPAG